MASINVTRGLLIVGALFVSTASARAQQSDPTYPRGSSPTVSPYLMLLPQNSSIGAIPASPGTYQAIVRPALQAREIARQALPQNQAYVPGQAGAAAKNVPTNGVNPSIRPTGHAATYRNYSHYFPGAKK